MFTTMSHIIFTGAIWCEKSKQAFSDKSLVADVLNESACFKLILVDPGQDNLLDFDKLSIKPRFLFFMFQNV